MGKNILVIRSANLPVMDKLFGYLNENYANQEVYFYCLVQQNTMSVLQKKYPNVYYAITHDGFFDYHEFKKDTSLRKELNQDFDAVYIPSSTMSFDSYLDIMLIAVTIGVKKNIYSFFACDGEVLEKKVTLFGLWVEKYFGEFFYLFKLLFSILLIQLLSFIIFLWHSLIKVRINKPAT